MRSDSREPLFTRSHTYCYKAQGGIKKQVEEMVARDMIQPSRAPYTNPLVPVQKKDGSLRLCLDFRLLNEKIGDDRYPLSHTDTILHRLGMGKFFFSS